MTETAYRQEFQSEEMKVIVHIVPVSVVFPDREVSKVILVSPELKEEAKMLLTLASAVPDNGFVFNTNVSIFFPVDLECFATFFYVTDALLWTGAREL